MLTSSSVTDKCVPDLCYGSSHPKSLCPSLCVSLFPSFPLSLPFSAFSGVSLSSSLSQSVSLSACPSPHMSASISPSCPQPKTLILTINSPNKLLTPDLLHALIPQGYTLAWPANGTIPLAHILSCQQTSVKNFRSMIHVYKSSLDTEFRVNTDLGLDQMQHS